MSKCKILRCWGLSIGRSWDQLITFSDDIKLSERWNKSPWQLDLTSNISSNTHHTSLKIFWKTFKKCCWHMWRHPSAWRTRPYNKYKAMRASVLNKIPKIGKWVTGHLLWWDLDIVGVWRMEGWELWSNKWKHWPSHQHSSSREAIDKLNGDNIYLNIMTTSKYCTYWLSLYSDTNWLVWQLPSHQQSKYGMEGIFWWSTLYNYLNLSLQLKSCFFLFF